MPLNVAMHLHDITFVYPTFHIYTILMNATQLFTFTSVYLHGNRKHTSVQDRPEYEINFEYLHTGMLYIWRHI